MATGWRVALGAALLAVGVTGPAEAGERRARAPVRFTPSGHVKTFALGVFPYDSPLLPDAATGQGLVDARLNLDLEVGPVRLLAAHAITARIGDGAAAGAVGQSGVGLQAPEAVGLSWEAFGEGSFALVGRTDRLSVGLDVPGLRITVGRQPITFGAGLFFTPLDLVAPFTPATIDSEYKPGFDAARVDAYFGFTQVSVVAAYAGSWHADGMVLAAYGQTTVGATDLGLFTGMLRGDFVAGATLSTGVGPVGVHGDATVTVPGDPDAPPFFRGVIGATGRPSGTTFLSGEVYVQSLGARDADGILERLADPRWTRGELWLAGVAYAGVSVSQEIVPELTTSLATLVNLTDGSVLLAPALGWSVSDDAEVSVGGYAGLGRRPTVVDAEIPGVGVVEVPRPRNEFGLFPGVVFARVAAWW